MRQIKLQSIQPNSHTTDSLITKPRLTVATSIPAILPSQKRRRGDEANQAPGVAANGAAHPAQLVRHQVPGAGGPGGVSAVPQLDGPQHRREQHPQQSDRLRQGSHEQHGTYALPKTACGFSGFKRGKIFSWNLKQMPVKYMTCIFNLSRWMCPLEWKCPRHTYVENLIRNA